jgi:hypothetical protein
LKAGILADRILRKNFSSMFSSLLPAGIKGCFLLAHGDFLPWWFGARSTADWRLGDGTHTAAQVLGMWEVVST